MILITFCHWFDKRVVAAMHHLQSSGAEVYMEGPIVRKLGNVEGKRRRIHGGEFRGFPPYFQHFFLRCQLPISVKVYGKLAGVSEQISAKPSFRQLRSSSFS